MVPSRDRANEGSREGQRMGARKRERNDGVGGQRQRGLARLSFFWVAVLYGRTSTNSDLSLNSQLLSLRRTRCCVSAGDAKRLRESAGYTKVEATSLPLKSG